MLRLRLDGTWTASDFADLLGALDWTYSVVAVTEIEFDSYSEIDKFYQVYWDSFPPIPRLVDLVPVGGKLGMAGGAAPGKEARNMDHFCVRVEPFDETAIRRHLEAHGIEAGQVESRYGAEGEGPSLYLSDPEGNVVELKGPPAV